jgi:hypothetical protein
LRLITGVVKLGVLVLVALGSGAALGILIAEVIGT